jgi:DNA-binding NarL/FixJ family response regulator
MAKIDLVIADDHALVREGIIAILGMHEDLEVVGQASDGSEALKAAMKHKPRVVLMDVSMPGLGGLEATIELKKTLPDTKVLVLTQYDDKEYISRFLKAGASGYILKKAIGADLISAIRAVAAGESYLHPSIASGVIDGFLGRPEPGSDNGEGLYDSLTVREKQVLKLIAEGCSHKEAATELDISVKTVISHQSNICDKLDIHSRAGLIKFAIQKGLIKL